MANEELGGPMTERIRCLMCPRRWSEGDNWIYLKSRAVDPAYIFAGYFCSQGCATEWRYCDEAQRSFIIFGDAEKVDELRRRLRMAPGSVDPEPPYQRAIVEQTEPDIFSIPTLDDEGNLTGWRVAREDTIWRLWS